MIVIRLLSRLLGACLAPALAFAIGLPVTGAAHAQAALVATHGNWELRCDTPPGAQSEQCALMQWVQDEDRDNVGLVIIVAKTADQAAQILRVVAPMGILLPGGVILSIDGEEIGRAEYIRCQIEGCYVEILLDQELLDLFRGGTTATFVIFGTPEEGIAIPVPLDGFDEGFVALP